jgi:WD repeat and SOF domain-containing protein 1
VSSPEPVVVYNSRRATNGPKAHLIGAGPERTFINAWNAIDHHPGFPSRPSPGAILDLDLVMEKCDFGSGKVSLATAYNASVADFQYVRDCLEFLRIGAGLDNGKRVRRGNYLGQYKQTYYESPTAPRQLDWTPRKPLVRSPKLSRTPLSLPSPRSEVKLYDPSAPCDPDHPRLFHMFWAGPFTDKPYMAVMSFLFTQHLGLDKPLSESSHNVRATCRPQFWVWINPGPAAAVPNPNAKREMYESLATNPWSAPFLHERFRDTVKFKMWNTTEQLDGVDELAKHWRDMPIFNSGGNVYKQAQQAPSAVEEEPKIGDVLEDQGEEDLELINEAHAAHKKKDPLFEKVGSTSESEYDRLSVILSDMARFVLTYRFGGVYLDADTIFLRDWEELWNYRGQFAYRWSWHQKYNTAILKLHKGSALGRFLFKTALENGLDFHPMTVSRYLKDAGLEKLLFRIPDALFDPAWLNMERYQRERPPFPYFPE